MTTATLRLRERLNRKLGERIFLDAQKDLVGHTLDRRRPAPITATLLSIVVLASPFIAILLGALLIFARFPNIFFLIVGGVLICMGVILLPKRRKPLDELLERSQAPATFELLDQITDRMGTGSITHVMITPEYNAFMLHEGRKRVLGIGAVLWRATNAQERLAILAHEVAHQVNDDPARTGLTGQALQTLEGWLWFFEPDADEFLTELLMYLPFLALAAFHGLLLRLLFIESQRSEYLADALAAQAAGAEPLQSVIRKLMFAERLEIERLGMHPNRVPGGLTLVDRFASAVNDIPEQDREAIVAKANAEKLAVDSTHPPTAYRIAFLNVLDYVGPVPLDPGDMRQIDAELEAQFAKQGDVLQHDIQREESW